MPPRSRRGKRRQPATPSPESSPDQGGRTVRRSAKSRRVIQNESPLRGSRSSDGIMKVMSERPQPTFSTLEELPIPTESVPEISSVHAESEDEINPIATSSHPERVYQSAGKQETRPRLLGGRSKRNRTMKMQEPQLPQPNAQVPVPAAQEPVPAAQEPVPAAQEPLPNAQQPAHIGKSAEDLRNQIDSDKRSELEQLLDSASPFYKSTPMFNESQRKQKGMELWKKQILAPEDPKKNEIRELLKLPRSQEFDVVTGNPDKIRLPTDIPDNCLVAYYTPFEAGQWNLGLVYAYIPKYDVYVVEDYFYEDQKYFVTPSGFVRRIHYNREALKKGGRVLARYPNCSLFYEGKITKQLFNKWNVVFDPEGDDGKLRKAVDVHHIFDVGILKRPENFNAWLNKDSEIEALEMAPACRMENLPIMPDVPDHLIVSSAPSAELSNDINYLRRTGLLTEECNEVKRDHPHRVNHIILVRTEDQVDTYHLCIVTSIDHDILRCDDLSKKECSHMVWPKHVRKFPEPTAFETGKKVLAKYPDKAVFYPAILKEDKGSMWTVAFEIPGKRKLESVHKIYITDYRQPSQEEIDHCARYRSWTKQFKRSNMPC